MEDKLKNRSCRQIIISCICLLLLFFLGSCSTTKKVEPNEMEKISALVKPRIDSMMQGFSDNNYQKYSEYFDAKMRTGLPESGFDDTRKLITGKIGNYQSYEIADILETQNFITVVCYAVFENEEKVTIRVIFDPNADYSISGIWYDSPELRK